jgi:acyl-CoA thioesterase FadM
MNGRAMQHAPEGAFVQTARVRSYEVGRDGAIGIGTILRYFEALATEASAALGFDFRWYERHDAAWVVREMDVLVGTPLGIGDELTLATWVADFRRVQAQREYAIWRRDDGRRVARASARWGYVDRVRGQPTRLQDELANGIPVVGHRMAVRRHLPPPAEGGPPAMQGELLLTAREYETDSQQHINNCVYGDWLAEGLHGALQEMRETALVLAARPRYYQIEYVRPALAGDAVRVATAAAAQGRRGLFVWQEIAGASDGGVFVRARSAHLWARSEPRDGLA